MSNLLDLGVVLVIVVCIAFGLYQGGVVSALHTLGLFFSWGAAYIYYPKTALYIQADRELFDMLLHYSDGAKRLATTAQARAAIDTLSKGQIDQYLGAANMPYPFENLIKSNIDGRVFASMDVTTLGDYVNYTIVTVGINIVSFLLILLITYVVLCVLINLVNYVIRFPMLRQLDMVFGGLLGFFRGVFIVHAIFSLLPIGLAILPSTLFEKENFITLLFDKSMYLPTYYNKNMILRFIKGFLP